MTVLQARGRGFPFGAAVQGSFEGQDVAGMHRRLWLELIATVSRSSKPVLTHG